MTPRRVAVLALVLVGMLVASAALIVTRDRGAATTITISAGESIEAAVAANPGIIVELGPGRHPAFTLDVAATIRGQPGSVVEGGIAVFADEVRLEDLVVEGGESGVLVREADGVVLERVAVSGAALHGIEIVDASATIRECSVDGLASEYGQGIEVRNANGRPRTVIEGCRITGGQEGIVAHVSRVELRDNIVSFTTMRGLAVTEMSEGVVERNTVTDVQGVGLYCGDMSHCEVRDNEVRAVRADPSGVRSRSGQALVAWFHSTVRLHENNFDVTADEPVGVYDGSSITDQFPLEHWTDE